jgi:eukaryotic translation initiation factor 2C
LTGFLIHSRFAAEDGKQKSVVQYFLEKYNIRLRFASWPALQSGNDSRPIFLPMEVIIYYLGYHYHLCLTYYYNISFSVYAFTL